MKKLEAEKLKKRNAKLLNMLMEERQKVEGYNELFKVHTAYISILLKKLGATEDKAVTISQEEVKGALEKLEPRAVVEGNGDLKLYFAEVER